MREIKFRAWDRDYKCMVYQSPTVVAAKILDRYDVVMQFTGLHDKYGKEIYEGDILNINYQDAMFINVPVTFENGCFYTIYQNIMYRLGGWIKTSIEVIGNIHEHPRLLQE